MKWTLDLEKKYIELNIEDDRFVLKTKDHDVQFDMNRHVAYRMLMQMKSILEPPRIPDGEMIDHSTSETLMMGFVLNQNDHWVMDLRYGDAAFNSEMSYQDLSRFLHVIREYFEVVRANNLQNDS